VHIELAGNLGRLRDPRSQDAASLARYANNRNVWLNLRDGFPHPYSVEDAKRFVAMAKEHRPPTILAIETAGAPPEAIGAIGLRLQPDVERVSAELGYWIGEPFWGRGIVTAAVRAMVTYAFGTFELTRVFALPYTSNAASARVLEKAGFRQEARMLRAVIKDGQVQDQWMYAVTDDEWQIIGSR